MSHRPRIRTLKPEIWKDEAVAAVSHEARLLFIGLITMVDDAGRMRLAVPAIVGHVYPFETIPAQKVQRWLEELEREHLIAVYEYEGRSYAWLPGWRANQKINRPTPSKYPCPPFSDSSWSPHDGLIESSVNGHGAFTE